MWIPVVGASSAADDGFAGEEDGRDSCQGDEVCGEDTTDHIPRGRHDCITGGGQQPRRMSGEFWQCSF